MRLDDIKRLSIVQFDAYSLVSQIVKLEQEHTLIQSTGLGMGGKNLRNVLNGTAARMETLRKGKVSEEDVIEAQLDGLLGESIGPIPDSGLASLGIGMGPKPE